jgi:transcription elongation factor SPT6
VIIGFPFDEKTFRDQPSEEQELLKIEMALDFPHKDNDRHDGSRHDCMSLCFPSIVKEIHPLIDLEKDRFDLRKEDRPVIEVKEEKMIPKNLKADLRRISHPKYKNIGAIPAIEMIKDAQIQIGDFIIRPSSQGPEYLTITWKFFKGVIVHIKVKCEHRGMNSMNMTYRIEDRDNRSYNSLEEIIEKCIKPMNVLVQDITSNKKFLDRKFSPI